jgi:hypothetical protein
MPASTAWHCHQQDDQGMDQLNMAGEAVKQVPEHGVMVSAANRGGIEVLNISMQSIR